MLNGVFAEFDNATGATITKGEIVYHTGTANQVAPARANAIGTLPAIAIAVADVADGASGNFMLMGICHDTSAFPTLAIGGEVYVSDGAAGEITTTIPDADGEFIQVIGVALHGDKFLFNPDFTLVEIA